MKTAEQQLTSFLAKYTPEMQKAARAARRKLRGLFPQAIEIVYDNYNALVIGYGPTERTSDAICSIAVYPKWITLFFLDGAKLHDPQKLLQGSGKIVRQIRLSDAADLDQPAIRELIAQAFGRSAAPFDGPHKLVIKSVSAKQRPRRPPAK
jgi:hypothetical protein